MAAFDASFSLEQLNRHYGCSAPNKRVLYEMIFGVPVTDNDDVWNLPVFDEYKRKEQEFEKYIVSPHEVEEGVLICHKCKSKKITAYSRQTRSGDEPMTVFAKCSMCQHQWVQ